MTTHDLVLRLEALNSTVQVDPRSGALASLRLAEPLTQFVARPAAAGLLRFALPLDDHPGHHVEAGTHGAPEIEAVDGALRLRYAALSTEEGPVAATVEITLTAAADGLRLHAAVHNTGDATIPQVLFPQLLGLAAIDGPDETRLQLARGKMRPLRELAMRPDDAHFLEVRMQRYITYGYGAGNPHAMKWCDYGSSRRGLTLYSRDTRETTQALLVDRPDRAAERINLSWVHYPFIQPGETWDSGDFVLLPHAGDWYAGARAYQRYAAGAYPYNAPRRIREALGVRTIWAAVRSARPTFPLSDLAEYAAEIADPELDLAELIVWHWWRRNGYPIFLDPRLGAEADFRAALDRCRALGVPVSLFVSHKLQRDNPRDTDPSWVFLNAAGQRILSNWTYGEGFSPRFGPPFIGTHSMVYGSARSPGWRAAGLEQYRQIQEKYGPVSICFDQFHAWPDPDFNPAGDGRPNEEGEHLLAFGREAREIVRQANGDTNPDATFSGEHMTDTRVPVLDYTWEWKNGFDIEQSAPFRYVFPQVRLNANVNEHPRGALLAFMEGALLNVMPGNMRSHRLRDHPTLVAVLRKLAALRRRFLPFFVEGQYRYTEELTATGCTARLYTHGDSILVIATNPTDTPTQASLVVGADELRASTPHRSDSADPADRADPADATLTVFSLDGDTVEQRQVSGPGPVSYALRLDPDSLVAIQITR
jgi:hypothetical protein